MRRHLYAKIYTAFLGITLLCTVAAGLLSSLMHPDWGEGPAGAHAAAVLVMEGIDEADLQTTLEARADQLEVRLALFTAQGAEIATTDRAIPAPDGPGWVRNRYAMGMAVALDDGRLLVVAKPHPPHRKRGVFMLLALLGVVALGCLPLARGITRRVEALQAGVAAWGEGDLSRRVRVEGCDEVGELAQNFNEAAERIEELVGAQRRVLAHASHELRSPLARLRLALALLPEGEHSEEAVRNVEELDDLIEDLLLSARLQSGRTDLLLETTDLGELLRSEAERVQATAQGDATAAVDPRLLRLALRNLLENARKYGGDEVEATLQTDGDLLITICDRGPGVPEPLRERIFEPYYRPDGYSEAHGGLGLGLALVRRVAEAHGGAVICRAREGGGACFELRLRPSEAAAP